MMILLSVWKVTSSNGGMKKLSGTYGVDHKPWLQGLFMERILH